MVFQDYENALLPWRTVRATSRSVWSAAFGGAERDDGSSEALAMVGLAERGADHPGNCPAAWRNGSRSPARWPWSRPCC